MGAGNKAERPNGEKRVEGAKVIILFLDFKTVTGHPLFFNDQDFISISI